MASESRSYPSACWGRIGSSSRSTVTVAWLIGGTVTLALVRLCGRPGGNLDRSFGNGSHVTRRREVTARKSFAWLFFATLSGLLLLRFELRAMMPRRRWTQPLAIEARSPPSSERTVALLMLSSKSPVLTSDDPNNARES
jgi:hypothetical protein